MFRGMRRKNQALSPEKCEEILQESTSGVLNLIGDDGYPYGVPLSYVKAGDKIYFHSAKTGHKIDAIRNNEKASFTVIYKDDVQGEKFTTWFTSVIAFGKVRILEDPEEIMTAITTLAKRYAPPSPKMEEAMQKNIHDYKNAMAVMELSIEHMTGKAAMALMKK